MPMTDTHVCGAYSVYFTRIVPKVSITELEERLSIISLSLPVYGC